MLKDQIGLKFLETSYTNVAIRKLNTLFELTYWLMIFFTLLCLEPKVV